MSTKASTSVFSTQLTFDELKACWELCRLHNNIGFWVVWLPTIWSITMAYHAQPEVSATQALSCAILYVPLCFGIKSLIMTIDDILDADVDGLVERTKNRPIPRGSISLRRAWIFFYCQAALGIVLATKYLSPIALWVSVLVWPIYIIYPTCKRWTNLNPLPLGIMFNVGVFMGWADLNPGRTSLPLDTLLPVYIGACLWTFTYETVYQHQDKKDDVKLGLYSPALLFGKYTTPICATTALGFFALLSYAGILNGQGILYFVGILIAATRLMSLLIKTDLDVPEDCRKFFLDNVHVGQIIALGLVLDVALHRFLTGVPF